MKDKSRIILTSIVLATLLIAVCLAFVFAFYAGTVMKIKVKEMDQDNLKLKISYCCGMGGYSVRNVTVDEGEYTGDGIRDYDGSIGKYRILVTFGDIEPNAALQKKLSAGDYFKLENKDVQLKTKIAYPSDHGFAFYIGSDQPIHVDDTNGSNLNGLFGNIKIPIRVGDKG